MIIEMIEFKNFSSAILELLNKNYFVVRMGNIAETKLNIKP